jgi:hypothetical protein
MPWQRKHGEYDDCCCCCCDPKRTSEWKRRRSPAERREAKRCSQCASWCYSDSVVQCVRVLEEVSQSVTERAQKSKSTGRSLVSSPMLNENIKCDVSRSARTDRTEFRVRVRKNTKTCTNEMAFVPRRFFEWSTSKAIVNLTACVQHTVLHH